MDNCDTAATTMANRDLCMLFALYPFREVSLPSLCDSERGEGVSVEGLVHDLESSELHALVKTSQIFWSLI